MKTRMFAVVFAFLCSLVVANRAGAQGCQPTINYSNYSSQSFDDSTFTLTQTVTTEGYSSMDLEYCPPARTATHTPFVRNTLTAPNGTVYGGNNSGSGGCVTCYLEAQSTVNIVGAPGDTWTSDVEGWVQCSVAGIFWQVTTPGKSRFIQAYYKCTDVAGGQCAADSSGLHPYARCNPQGDLCDSERLGISPVTGGGWPLYGLFNAILYTSSNLDACQIGFHGTRTDNCYKPDPHP